MAREIRAPELITDEMDAWHLLADTRMVAEIVARYSHYTEAQAMESIMRVVGHLCATGGDAG